MVIKIFVNRGKERFENRTHGENGGSRIDRSGLTVNGAHFSARGRVLLKYLNIHSCMGQPQGSGKPANPCADDNHGFCVLGQRAPLRDADNPSSVDRILTTVHISLHYICQFYPTDAGEEDDMSLHDRIETTLVASVKRGQMQPAPPRLAAALDYALFPGGARVRPQICLSVAHACGDDAPQVANAAAASIELIHCASLIHDDLPCFDDAAIRRGKPSVHVAFGEELAVLAGDALIIMAFETLAKDAATAPDRLAGLVMSLARMTGMPRGICAGQGWESEKRVDLSAYHQAKTGSLFEAATQMGALAAGADPEPWADLGALIGEAYQVADDLRDTLLDETELGKPAGQDAVCDRPNAVAELGVKGAMRKLEDTLSGAIASIPSCPGEAELCALVQAQAKRLSPLGHAAANV